MSSKEKLRLFSGSRAEKRPSNTRLHIGNYIADILIDQRSYATVYHWIVQKAGSAEIIAWSQEKTFPDAEEAARACLRTLTGLSASRE